MPVLALGVSYRRAPIELLERMAFADEAYAKAYDRLVGLESVREGVILSTCNRVEVYADVPLYHQGFQDLKRFLADATEVQPDDFAEPLYSHYEDDAAEHLFAVAAGLDSMVLGEPQILAQVRAAVRRADAEGAAGPALADLFRRAVRAGRRVRAETGLGTSPAAFVEAGAWLAGEHLGGLAGRTGVVVGAGEMGALAARTLRDRGVEELTVLSRRPHRAERLASKLGGRHGPLERLPKALGKADVVVSCTGATSAVISADMLGSAARDRTVFVLDLAVPRDVEPAAAALPGVRLVDIDGLRAAVRDLRGSVDEELAAARAVVAEETRRYALARRTRRLAPLIEALHTRAETVRADEVRRMAARLGALSQADRDAVELATRRIVARLIHDPTVRLKDLAGRGLGDQPSRVLADLFGLEVPED